MSILLAVSTFSPDTLPWNKESVITVREAEPPVDSAAPKAGSFSTAAKKAMPAVVNIFTSKELPAPQNPFRDDPLFRRFFGSPFDHQPQRASSLGSGVIVSADGYILTNDHVVETADEIEIALADGRRTSAKVVGIDPDTDLAVLKIELKNLPAISFGHSDQVQVGDVALAIGNPFGVGQTVTMGIVSALGRSHLGINTFENFIQTDAAINPGNSGGALVDIHGNLIGINSAIYSRSGGSLGIGFAIPATLAKQVMEQILRHGSVVRGWIGVEVQDITPEIAETFKLQKYAGVLIAGVLRGGPADRGGVKPGDLLTGIDGKQVGNSTDMLNLIAALSPGQAAKLRILRNQTEADLIVNIGKRPKTRPNN